MYRFAFRPLWILSHLLVLLLIVGLASLGFWQLRRLDEREARNHLIEARAAEPAADIAELIDRDPADVRFSQVSFEGTPSADARVLIDNRSFDGRPGAWLMTPVEAADGRTVIANLGYLPYTQGLDVDLPEVLGNRVDLAGTAQTDAGRSCTSAQVKDIQVDNRYNCIDIDLIAADLGLTDVVPFVVDLDAQTVSAATSQTSEEARLIPVPPPELDEGPHLSYAVQWFIFTAIAVFGYPLVLRKVANRHDPDNPDNPDDLDSELAELLENP